MNGPLVVVGAGLSGLACALDLARAGRDVTVLEAALRAGGVVGTSAVGGFRFEDGPNTVPATSVEFRRLVHDLGLDGRLIASRDVARDRFLYYKGRLRPLPRGPGSFLATPLLSAGAKLRLLTEPFRVHRKLSESELEPSLASFLRERLGPEPTEVLAGAFVRGVFAAELDELGAASAFPRLWSLAQEHGGLVRGMLARRRAAKVRPARPPELPDRPAASFPRGSLLTFEHGLVELVEALGAALGDRLVLGAAARRIERASAGGWRVVRSDGIAHDAAHVILAVPAGSAVELLLPIVPAGFPLDVLSDVRHAELTLVHLGLACGELSIPPGFGYLVPPGGEIVTGLKPPGVLGTIFVSSLFSGRAPEGSQAVSSFYKTADLGADGAVDERVIERAAHDLARAVGADRAPRVAAALVRRWKDVLPRYAPGHARRIAALVRRVRAELPGIELAGNYVAGVSVEEVIGRGRAVAQAVLGGVYDPEPFPEAAEHR